MPQQGTLGIAFIPNGADADAWAEAWGSAPVQGILVPASHHTPRTALPSHNRSGVIIQLTERTFKAAASHSKGAPPRTCDEVVIDATHRNGRGFGGYPLKLSDCKTAFERVGFEHHTFVAHPEADSEVIGVYMAPSRLGVAQADALAVAFPTVARYSYRRLVGLRRWSVPDELRVRGAFDPASAPRRPDSRYAELFARCPNVAHEALLIAIEVDDADAYHRWREVCVQATPHPNRPVVGTPLSEPCRAAAKASLLGARHVLAELLTRYAPAPALLQAETKTETETERKHHRQSRGQWQSKSPSVTLCRGGGSRQKTALDGRARNAWHWFRAVVHGATYDQLQTRLAALNDHPCLLGTSLSRHLRVALARYPQLAGDPNLARFLPDVLMQCPADDAAMWVTELGPAATQACKDNALGYASKRQLFQAIKMLQDLGAGAKETGEDAAGTAMQTGPHPTRAGLASPQASATTTQASPPSMDLQAPTKEAIQAAAERADTAEEIIDAEDLWLAQQAARRAQQAELAAKL